MITLEHVSKLFASRGQTVRAVDDVSFEVGAGRCPMHLSAKEGHGGT